MTEHKEDIAFLVIEQQYEKGISGNSKPLMPYSKEYGKRKAKDGKNRGYTDFSCSGKMQQEMTLVINEDSYAIISNAETKSGYSLSTLLSKRDPQSFDLTDENKAAAYRIIEPEFAERIRELI